MDDIRGKTALVTGSGQGLGRVIAGKLAEQGCHVLINCRHHPENAQRVCKEISDAGGSAEMLLCDISDEKEVMEKISPRPVDILVNNARLDPYKRPPETSDGAWFNAMVHVKLTGAYLCIRAASRGMQMRRWCIRAASRGMQMRRWGRILNISSVQAHLGMSENLLPYSVANLGLHALTRCYAKLLGEYGITVNTLAPGMIRTENMTLRLTESEIASRLKSYPLHRAATAEEIAETALYAVRCGVRSPKRLFMRSAAVS